MSIAPPGCTSSAGWKISRTRPGSAGARASARPAPSSIAVCASCPQACMTFVTVEANGSPVASCSGRASMSARSATQRSPWPTSQTRPVPPGRVRGSRPAAVSSAADQRRGAALGPAQLRRGVQRATPGDDLGPVQRQPGVQPGRTAARAQSTTAGPATGRTRGARPAPSSDLAAGPPLRRSVVHQPILLTRTAVYQAITTSTGIRAPRGCRSAADGRDDRRGRAVLRRTG